MEQNDSSNILSGLLIFIIIIIIICLIVGYCRNNKSTQESYKMTTYACHRPRLALGVPLQVETLFPKSALQQALSNLEEYAEPAVSLDCDLSK